MHHEEKLMQGIAGKVQRSQGGTDVDQGLDSVGTPGVIGDHASPTFYTRQDDSRETRIANKKHEV